MKFSSAATMLIAAAMTASTTSAFTSKTHQRHWGQVMTPSRQVVAESSTALQMVGLSNLFKGKDEKEESTKNAYPEISEEHVRSLFSLWNNALATGDSRIVAARYAKEAVLLPTVSDIPRTDYNSIKDYFDSFLLKKPQGVILDGKIRIGEGWAQDAG